MRKKSQKKTEVHEWFYLYATLEDENAAVTTVAKAPRDAGELPMQAGTWGLAWPWLWYLSKLIQPRIKLYIYWAHSSHLNKAVSKKLHTGMIFTLWEKTLLWVRFCSLKDMQKKKRKEKKKKRHADVLTLVPGIVTLLEMKSLQT